MENKRLESIFMSNIVDRLWNQIIVNPVPCIQYYYIFETEYEGRISCWGGFQLPEYTFNAPRLDRYI
jgi:hypothetical protein